MSAGYREKNQHHTGDHREPREDGSGDPEYDYQIHNEHQRIPQEEEIHRKKYEGARTPQEEEIHAHEACSSNWIALAPQEDEEADAHSTQSDAGNTTAPTPGETPRVPQDS